MNDASPVVAVPAVEPTTVLPARVKRRRWPRLLAALAALLLLVALGALFVALRGGWYQARPLALGGAPAADGDERLAKRLAALSPRGIYVVVDSFNNRLRVVEDGEVLREAVCSTGSGTVLKDPEKGRVWVFDTPLGERRVQRKVKNPVWVKPDWAFIEEGFKPPPKDHPERYDDFSLGAYGLYLGDGYIIHGTIFQTLLGQRITHGCIRLGDADLEYVYKTVPLGARVYLY
jgi:L,D-transpeptidase YbiS